MNIGIVSHWFNRGQATVGRHIRSIFDSLGHNTFVLARPTKGNFHLPGFVDGADVWNQPGVTRGSGFDMPTQEYAAWAAGNKIEVAFFDQNYQFEAIAAMRAAGIATVGRFVWESFAREHAGPAKQALTIIYSLTRCEQERYAGFGIDSPYVQWGCHPELLAVTPERPPGAVRYFYPGGFLSARKPNQAVMKAFTSIKRSDIRLIVKTQRPTNAKDQIDASGDPRILVMADDLPMAEYYKLFASCHICLAPSRWEGLGLHLFEAMALGMPTITNDIPPMNEVVQDGHNGILVKSHLWGHRSCGLPGYDPDVADLARAIENLADRRVCEEMSRHAQEAAQARPWDMTVQGFAALLERAEALSGRATS